MLPIKTKLFFLSVLVSTAQVFGISEDFSVPDKIKQVAPYKSSVFQEERRGPGGKFMLTVTLDEANHTKESRTGWDIAPEIVDDQIFSIYVYPKVSPLAWFSVNFLDAAGNIISTHAWKSLPPERWTQLSFTASTAGDAAFFAPSSYQFGRKVARIELGFSGDKGQQIILCDLHGQTITDDKTADSGSFLAIRSGGNVLKLNPKRNFALVEAEVNGHKLLAVPGQASPTFYAVNTAGETKKFRPSDENWNCRIVRQTQNSLTVIYQSKDGSIIEIEYEVKPDRIVVTNRIVKEAELRFESVENFLMTGMNPEDYGIAPNGKLLQCGDGRQRTFSHEGQSDYQTPNMVALRTDKSILYYKPLNYSNNFSLTVRQRKKEAVAEIGGKLYFRPAGFQNPATKLVHDKLAWQLETAGDVNHDGVVDWVDCGLAYRDRYIKPNRNLNPLLRDNFIYYHQGFNYERVAEVCEKLDFASGIWWVKRMLNDAGAADAFIYDLQPVSALGELADVKARIRKTGSRVGPHYSMDAIGLDGGGWPEEFIKQGPDGKPQRYCMMYRYADRKPYQIYYLDYLRAVKTGKFYPWLDNLMQACRQSDGDIIMLDTFICYGRPGYNPEFPSTGETESEVKHEITKYLKEQKGITVTSEGIVEGGEDVTDYSAGGYNTREWMAGKLWQSSLPEKYVPLNTVIYHGATYKGLDWYALRQKEPNYAAAMILCGKFWDWSSVQFDNFEILYAHCAKRFFMNNLFWAQVSDAKIINIRQKNAEWILTFDNGAAITTNPDNDWFMLKVNGITYDGFTPFSRRGVMAIFKPGELDMVLPIKEDVELLASQPNYDKLKERIRISRTEDGFIKVTGRYDDLKWKNKFMGEVNGKEQVKDIEVEPLLLLNRKNK